MVIKPFYEPGTGTWTYLLSDPARGAAAVIDPVLVFDPVSGLTDSAFIEQVMEAAAAAGCRIEWVLETHAHADHVTAADLIRRKTGARIACGKGICAVQETFSRVFGMDDTATDGRQFDRLLSEGDRITVGEVEIRVLETPGHTGDSVSYLVGDAAFIGDTLFAPAFGTARCDFPGGDAAQLYDSIRRLYQLPRDTRLFLCHDYPEEGQEPRCEIPLAESMSDNVHLREDTERSGFVAMRRERDAQLGLPRLILPSLQLNILAGAPPEPESNGVVYLKTPLDRPLAKLIEEHDE
ncbi:MAG: MBL fold metallo-hydrolase [Gammaproteobacteria bacterium]|nr:MBL fold metallo-hydrolase [Gammaproteobacteria bacterium]